MKTFYINNTKQTTTKIKVKYNTFQIIVYCIFLLNELTGLVVYDSNGFYLTIRTQKVRINQVIQLKEFVHMILQES